jgi:hypothetical protein
MNAPQKGRGPVTARFAQGGDVITTRSRFLKTPDSFRHDSEKTNFTKVGKGGSQSKLEGDTKSETPIKPRT